MISRISLVQKQCYTIKNVTQCVMISHDFPFQPWHSWKCSSILYHHISVGLSRLVNCYQICTGSTETTLKVICTKNPLLSYLSVIHLFLWYAHFAVILPETKRLLGQTMHNAAKYVIALLSNDIFVHVIVPCRRNDVVLTTTTRWQRHDALI